MGLERIRDQLGFKDPSWRAEQGAPAKQRGQKAHRVCILGKVGKAARGEEVGRERAWSQTAFPASESINEQYSLCNYP